MPSENRPPMSPSAQAAWNAAVASLPQAVAIGTLVAQAHADGQQQGFKAGCDAMRVAIGTLVAQAHADGQQQGFKAGCDAMRVAIQNRAILAPEAS